MEGMTLSQWLQQNRGAMTARAFAVAVGVHVGTVHKWCAGENVPRPRQMRRISEVTEGKVAPADFYGAAPGVAA